MDEMDGDGPAQTDTEGHHLWTTKRNYEPVTPATIIGGSVAIGIVLSLAFAAAVFVDNETAPNKELRYFALPDDYVLPSKRTAKVPATKAKPRVRSIHADDDPAPYLFGTTSYSDTWEAERNARALNDKLDDISSDMERNARALERKGEENARKMERKAEQTAREMDSKLDDMQRDAEMATQQAEWEARRIQRDMESEKRMDKLMDDIDYDIDRELSRPLFRHRY